MFLKVFTVLVFIGILSGLARLLKSDEIDLENQNNELIKCFECGNYFPRDFSVISSKSQLCKNCKS
tara:strand:- start:19 stop:216 length:198 start_codon:yes stop_codon:yes gene_type:complete